MIVLPINSKTQGEHFIFIDGEDFDRIKNYRWSLFKNGKTFYARALINGKAIQMHRLLLDFPESIVDHKNRNGLDNRRDNLRICSRAENAVNSRKQNNTSSIYKGVSFRKTRKKYTAYIGDRDNRIQLGLFIDEHDAGEAYNKKAIELYGEFANLNIIRREDI